jgi:Leucine Rich repeat
MSLPKIKCEYQDGFRLYRSDDYFPVVIVSEEYAHRLDSLRQSRHTSASRSGDDTADANSWVGRPAFVEDIFRAFDLLPDQTAIAQLELEEHAPQAVDHGDRGADCEMPGRCRYWGEYLWPQAIHLYEVTSEVELASRVLHLWAHAFAGKDERARYLFKLAYEYAHARHEMRRLEVSRHGYDLYEDFAVQLADVILASEESTFQTACSTADITAVVLSRILADAHARTPYKLAGLHSIRFDKRLEHIERTVRPRCLSSLLSDAKRRSGQSLACRLLFYLGSEEDWWHLRDLDALHLWSEYVTDKQLAFLKVLKSLKSLDLGRTAITSRGLEYIGNLTSLTNLNLEGTGVTNSAMGHLRQLCRLETLNLADTSVGDPGVVELLHLSALKSIDLRDTEITSLGVNVLQHNLPDCEILT